MNFKIVNPDIEKYLYGLSHGHDEEVLLEMEKMAQERSFPIVGRLVGMFLEVLAKSIVAKRVFEFGSGYGYSAFWFGRGVGSSGKVICTEGDDKNVGFAKKYFERLKMSECIEYHCGWAQDVFKKTTGEFDIIYNDVDKDAYPEVWQLAKDRIRSGGFYIADNVLWSGRVLQEKVEEDVAPGWTEAIQKHNLAIANDPNFDFFINPTRDGVIVARRK